MSYTGKSGTPTVQAASDARAGRYRGVLPKALQIHYDESDAQLMNLLSKAALLDAFLQKTLSEMGEGDSGFDTKRMLEVCHNLLLIQSDDSGRALVQILINELKGRNREEVLENKARKLIQEFVEVSKASTSQLTAIGGMLSLNQVAAVINGVMTLALKYMASTTHAKFSGPDADRERAADFIATVRRTIVNTPEMGALNEAANVRFTSSMGNADIPATGHGTVLD